MDEYFGLGYGKAKGHGSWDGWGLEDYIDWSYKDGWNGHGDLNFCGEARGFCPGGVWENADRHFEGNGHG